MEIVSVDLGGTNVRFAIAEVAAGRVTSLGPPVTLHTADYASLTTAWAAYATLAGRALPRAAALAVACPVGGEVLKLTNSPWVLRPAALPAELGVDLLTLINDFGAVGHAVAQLPADTMRHLAGPDVPLAERGVIAVLGPGTGLGVAQVIRHPTGYDVVETEGGHADFAPVDTIDDALLTVLRARYGRVSVERVVSGPALAATYEHLASMQGQALRAPDDHTLWAAAMDGSDPIAAAALQRFCLALGSFAGNLALAQGAQGVVIGGGLGARIAAVLPASGFAARFVGKGRLEALLSTIPVKLVTHPEPGQFGAAAAFAKEHTA